MRILTINVAVALPPTTRMIMTPTLTELSLNPNNQQNIKMQLLTFLILKSEQTTITFNGFRMIWKLTLL